MIRLSTAKLNKQSHWKLSTREHSYPGSEKSPNNSTSKGYHPSECKHRQFNLDLGCGRNPEE